MSYIMYLPKLQLQINGEQLLRRKDDKVVDQSKLKPQTDERRVVDHLEKTQTTMKETAQMEHQGVVAKNAARRQ